MTEQDANFRSAEATVQDGGIFGVPNFDADGNTLRRIKTTDIRPNPSNPRLYFNEENLDQLKTSIQEVGVLVPIIVYEASDEKGGYVLLDGERRWKCALELGLEEIPANIIPEPSETENLLRMFNIHSVRDEWPLISIALSLEKVINLTGEDRETRLAEMTGLTRGTVRRAKRILRLPRYEIDLIQKEAHLDRADQVHREDLYLEIEAATSVLLNQLPELSHEFSREFVIRQFARKREEGHLRAVTEFRAVGKLVNSVGLVDRNEVLETVRVLVEDVEANPVDLYEDVAATPTERQSLVKKSNQLISAFERLGEEPLDEEMIAALRRFRDRINQLLEK